jgi:hypothetical protein
VNAPLYKNLVVRTSTDKRKSTTSDTVHEQPVALASDVALHAALEVTMKGVRLMASRKSGTMTQ